MKQTVYQFSNKTQNLKPKSRLNIPLCFNSEPCIAFSAEHITLCPKISERIKNIISFQKSEYLARSMKLKDLIHIWLSVLSESPMEYVYVPNMMLFDLDMLTHFEYFTGVKIFSNTNSRLKTYHDIMLAELHSASHNDVSLPPPQETWIKNVTRPCRDPSTKLNILLKLNEETFHKNLLNKIFESLYLKDLILSIKKIRVPDLQSLSLQIPTTTNFGTSSFYNDNANSIKHVKADVQNLNNSWMNQDFFNTDPYTSFSIYHKTYLRKTIHDAVFKKKSSCSDMLFIVVIHPEDGSVYFIPFFGILSNYCSILRSIWCSDDILSNVLNLSLSDLCLKSEIPLMINEINIKTPLTDQSEDFMDDSDESHTRNNSPLFFHKETDDSQDHYFDDYDIESEPSQLRTPRCSPSEPTILNSVLLKKRKQPEISDDENSENEDNNSNDTYVENDFNNYDKETSYFKASSHCVPNNNGNKFDSIHRPIKRYKCITQNKIPSIIISNPQSEESIMSDIL